MSSIHSSLLIPLHGGAVTPAQIELTVFFLVGLLGGAHCLGMCGPLVTMYAKEMTPTQQSRNNVLTLYEVRQHALFNLGRTLSYATLGGLFGLAGALVFDVSATVTTLGSAIRATMGILVASLIVCSVVGRLAGCISGLPLGQRSGWADPESSDSDSFTGCFRVHSCIQRSCMPSLVGHRPVEQLRLRYSVSVPFRRCSSTGRSCNLWVSHGVSNYIGYSASRSC